MSEGQAYDLPVWQEGLRAMRREAMEAARAADEQETKASEKHRRRPIRACNPIREM